LSELFYPGRDSNRPPPKYKPETLKLYHLVRLLGGIGQEKEEEEKEE
jgi:hypothetical protein